MLLLKWPEVEYFLLIKCLYLLLDSKPHWIMLLLDLLYHDEVLLLNLSTKLKLTAISLTVV